MVGVYIVLESYVDDVFGGADSKSHAADLIAQLIAVGKVTTAVMNLLKCKGPARVMEILGQLFDAGTRKVTLPPGKRTKYLGKVREVLAATRVTSKTLEKLLGYLGYASWAEPFGRPLLSALGVYITRSNPRASVRLGRFATLALKI